MATVCKRDSFNSGKMVFLVILPLYLKLNSVLSCLSTTINVLYIYYQYLSNSIFYYILELIFSE